MIKYKSLLCTRSDNLITLLKFLLDANEINYIVENEHVVYYNPERKMCIKVEEGDLYKAKGLVEELPNRFKKVEVS